MDLFQIAKADDEVMAAGGEKKERHKSFPHASCGVARVEEFEASHVLLRTQPSSALSWDPKNTTFQSLASEAHSRPRILSLGYRGEVGYNHIMPSDQATESQGLIKMRLED